MSGNFFLKSESPDVLKTRPPSLPLSCPIYFSSPSSLVHPICAVSCHLINLTTQEALMFNCIEGTGLHFDPSLTGISREIERFPMDRRKDKTVDGLLMRGGWITFML